MSSLLPEGLVVPEVTKSSGRGKYGAMGGLFFNFLPGAWILSEVDCFLLLSALVPCIIAVINFAKYPFQADSQLSKSFRMTRCLRRQAGPILLLESSSVPFHFLEINIVRMPVPDAFCIGLASVVTYYLFLFSPIHLMFLTLSERHHVEWVHAP